MDMSGQQLRYSNGTLNSVALRTGGQIGCCEMYRNKNSCVCMMVKNKQSDFVTLPECSGMCTNQNINIYIENYETRINKEKYGLKYESGNLNTYPYYEMKSEGKMGELNNLYIGPNQFKPKPIYRDVLWTASSNKTDNSEIWDSAKNSSNLTYYPYLNNGNQYIKGKASLITEEVDKKTSANHVHLNISSGVEKSLMYNDKKYISKGYTDTNKSILNFASEQNSSIMVSGTSPSLCNNLYVAPPYFTVDKFVNPDQTNVRNTQHTQFSSSNLYSNNRPLNNGFECNIMENQSSQTRKNLIVNEREKIMGSNFEDNSKIHIEMNPVDFDMTKKHRHLPIKEENCDYEKDCISPKIEICQNKDNIHMNLPCIGNSIERNEFIKNKNNPPISFSIDHYDTLPINLVNPNLYSVDEFHARCNAAPQSNQHDIAFHGIQYTQYKKNCTHQAYAKQSYTNLFRPPAKAPNREIRKPNYRELINHVHALRSATSEDDLNMQIIKRTLNYKQLVNDGSSSVVSRKLSPGLANHHEHIRCGTTNVLSPLDLSVKTISNPDSIDSILNYKSLVTEIGYLPKFNFSPDFSEKRNAISMLDTMSAESEVTISNTLSVNQRSIENVKCKMEMNIPNHSTMNCNKNNYIDDYSLNKGLIVNNICSLQDSIISHIGKECFTSDSNQGADIKLEVTLKRTIPFDKGDENEFLSKKVCLESRNHSDLTATSYDVDLKKPLEHTDTTPKMDSKDCVVIGNTMQLSANTCAQNAKMNTNITDSYVATKNPVYNEPLISVIKSKQDVSSIIAARIRTKAELKGFIFQEDNSVFHKQAVSDKENCHCNYSAQLSSQMDEVDLSEWEITCNGFVDQLISNCMDLQSTIKESKLLENKFKLPSFQKSMSTCTKNHKLNLFQKTNITELSNKSKQADRVKTLPLLSSNNTFNSNVASVILGKDDTFKQKTEIKRIDNNNDCIESEQTRFSKVNKTFKCSEEKESEYVNNIESTQTSIQTNKTYLDLDICDKQKVTNIVTNNVKAIDLTKISVVRLKRENYTSKRYTSYDKNGKLIKNDETYFAQINKTKKISKANREILKIERSCPAIPKSTLIMKNVSFECPQRRKHIVNSVLEKGESKFDTITTRLQHKRLQLTNNSVSACKNKKGNNLKKENTRFRRQKPNDRELLNDPNKLFLEVYRYKRALKVPPNLITIKNSSVQRISSSLPDLDVDLQNSVLTKESNLNSEIDCKVEDIPKSIIDVLHSRVVKSKHQSKSSQKHYGIEHHTSKLVRQQYNNVELGLKVLNNNHSDREHRNVFETQVLTSRTRMEYKMQLNKEVIREIFGGSDRPASAPPEINNLSNEKDFKTKNNTSSSFQKRKFEAEQDIGNIISCEQHKPTIPTHLIRSNSVINRISKGQKKGCDQSVMQTKGKRKKSGRAYRRKFSSGFDYLRKRKRSNAHTLYNYSMLKTKAVNYMNEANLLFKNENDVSREIQKWVLNKSVGQSALHKAARLGYIDVIVYCLEKMKLNPDHKDNAGYTPLHDACINGSLEIARVLLQYGANHSEGAHSGIRPLHEASENGNIEIVRMLLSYGADPLLETYSGQTPLMLASDIEINHLISMHLLDVNEINKNSWRFPGPWKLFDPTENGYDAFNDASSLDYLYQIDKRKKFLITQNQSLKNDDFEIYVDTADAEGELFEFEEANMPLPPLYLLKDEGMEKWVLLSDLCSLLKVKSKETLLHKIFPSIPHATISRAFMRELKMCEFLEKATCLQLLCAGEKINICHSKVVLIQYNENVRKLLGVKTILMKL